MGEDAKKSGGGRIEQISKVALTRLSARRRVEQSW